MDALDDAGQSWCIGRCFATVADVGTVEVQRGGHRRPDLRVAAGVTHRGVHRRRRLAREVLEVHPQHLEEAGPAGLEALQFVVPVVAFGEQAVHHPHDAAVAGVAGDGDFGGHRRRVAAPAVLLVGEARRRFPCGDGSGRDVLAAVFVAEVECDCATDAFVDLGRGEPRAHAGTGRDGLPHLFRRARHEELHLDPAAPGIVLLQRHFTSSFGFG